MRFSVNLQCLYPEMSFAQGLIHLKDKGYDTVEDWTIPNDSVVQRAQLLREAGMRISAFCPDFFTLNDAACHARYQASLQKALDDANTMDCPALITQVGSDTGEAHDKQHNAIVSGLKRMAPLLEQAGVCLLVEPLNDVKDHPGYFLTSSQEGFEIIEQVGSPYVKLLFDVYHQVHMGEDVVTSIQTHLDLIGHFHIAAHPNRDEALFDHFDYDPVLRLIAESKTEAPVGIELMPTSLAAADALLDRLSAYR